MRRVAFQEQIRLLGSKLGLGAWCLGALTTDVPVVRSALNGGVWQPLRVGAEPISGPARTLWSRVDVLDSNASGPSEKRSQLWMGKEGGGEVSVWEVTWTQSIGTVC